MIIQANRISSGYSYSNESMNKNVGREQESDKKISNKNLGKTQIVDMKNNKNPIFMRKNQLKKGAMKIVTDAFAGEQKIDKGMTARNKKTLNYLRKSIIFPKGIPMSCLRRKKQNVLEIWGL